MSFSFKPLTEEQLSIQKLLQVGVYDFEVISAEDTVSKNGNSMIKLQLRVWDEKGITHIIYDYLVNISNMMYKIKHFCDSTNIIDKYNTGSLKAEDCNGLTGPARIDVQVGGLKQDGSGERYPTKNVVKDYVAKVTSTNDTSLKKEDDLDQDIPF